MARPLPCGAFSLHDLASFTLTWPSIVRARKAQTNMQPGYAKEQSAGRGGVVGVQKGALQWVNCGARTYTINKLNNTRCHNDVQSFAVVAQRQWAQLESEL